MSPRQAVKLPFVPPLRFLVLAAALALAGCSREPDSYAPPIQRQPLDAAEPAFVGPYVYMGNPNADAYIVKDVAPRGEGGTWRWAYRRPELQFYIGRREHLKFVMEFALADRTFAETGPVTLSVFINGKPLDRFRYDKPGTHSINKPVPAELLKADAVNRVAIEPDKVWTAREDGATLGFILTSAGFRE